MTGTAGMRPADIGELVDVGEPRVSPDGRGVAYVVTTIDATANRYLSRVWLVCGSRLLGQSPGFGPQTVPPGAHEAQVRSGP